MPTDRRRTVKESAQYLRDVRPIDPAEIATFVEGGAHPGTVRADLRALAPELGLLERADGTFTPVPTGPIEVDFDGVEALPERWSRLLEERLVERFGPGWPDGQTGSEIRQLITRLKAAYRAGDPLTYDTDVALAYAIYHLPTHYAATTYVLDVLGDAGLLDHHLRVLDVGAGVGGPALALIDYLPEDSLLEYDGIEPSAAGELLETFLEETGPNVHPKIHRETAEAVQPAATDYDLVLFSSVLSELDDPVATARRYLDTVATDGTMMLLSTGDRLTSTTLREVERAIVDEEGRASVFAPTVRLWPDERPTDRGWSWTREEDLAVPSFQTALADGDEGYLNTSVRYSYALLRPDGRRRHDVTLRREDFARMADAEDHVTERVDIAGAKLSPDLGSENPLFKISDGSEAVDHYAVLVHESELTATLRHAPYGALLSLQNVLVLWNDDEGGYNLVVDDESVVEYLG
jgi:2-polyprenyl-3-methyl-5-hydroxy-6-metoxy-1,4-benzoquinol methylase